MKKLTNEEYRELNNKCFSYKTDAILYKREALEKAEVFEQEMLLNLQYQL